MSYWETFKDWFLSLGENYNVDPIIFGAIYVGAIPFFFISLGWLIRNIRHGKSIVFPVLTTGFFFLSAYIYLIIVGTNIPIWVYFIIALLVIYGAYSTYKKVMKKKEGN